GRSYPPTVSRLSAGVARLRLSPSYVRGRRRVERRLGELPVVGDYLRAGVQGMRAALSEVFEPQRNFFKALGVRYVGPFDGHDVAEVERALRQASEFEGPI